MLGYKKLIIHIILKMNTKRIIIMIAMEVEGVESTSVDVVALEVSV
jgi:hypothetical protein